MSSLEDMPLSPGSARLSEYRQAIRIKPHLYSLEGSLATLHQIAWVEQRRDLVFHLLTVERDAIRADVETPKEVTVLDWGNSSAHPRLVTSAFHVTGILVRDEYRDMLRDIIRSANGGRQVGDGDMDIDVDSSSPDYNPFGTEIIHESHGAIVCGNPGIGKSAFLIYVLALRLLSRRATIFQRRSQKAYVLNNEGVFSVPGPVDDDLNFYIPPRTWFLVDSNQKLTEVPEELTDLCDSCGGFMIQAASPRIERIEWSKKAPKAVEVFFMASWSLEELIAGRGLQGSMERTMIAETALVNFAKLYGTSARHVYASARKPEPHEERVNLEISNVTMEQIGVLLHKAASLTIDDAISHHIVGVGPIPGNRCKFTAKILTDYLLDQILDHLKTSDEQAALNLYRVFTQVSYTRASAGHLLERTFFDVFPKGGEWPVTNLIKRAAGRENTHWHFDENAPHRYLRLGFPGPIVTIEDSPIDPSDGLRSQMEHYHFASGKKRTLERSFYIPQAKNQASFDAFAFEPDQRKATMFQVTVAEKHGISTVGLDWLKVCGADSIDLVVVTFPLHKHGKLAIDVANSHEDRLSNVYCLALKG